MPAIRQRRPDRGRVVTFCAGIGGRQGGTSDAANDLRAAQSGQSFAFETTLAGLGYARHIPRWQAAGYHVTLFYLTLPTPEMAIARVAERVRQGGHDVPESVIRRRFAVGWKNFEQIYRDAADAWVLYDNSGDEPELVDWGERA